MVCNFPTGGVFRTGLVWTVTIHGPTPQVSRLACRNSVLASVFVQSKSKVSHIHPCQRVILLSMCVTRSLWISTTRFRTSIFQVVWWVNWQTAGGYRG